MASKKRCFVYSNDFASKKDHAWKIIEVERNSKPWFKTKKCQDDETYHKPKVVRVIDNYDPDERREWKVEKKLHDRKPVYVGSDDERLHKKNIHHTKYDSDDDENDWVLENKKYWDKHDKCYVPDCLVCQKDPCDNKWDIDDQCFGYHLLKDKHDDDYPLSPINIDSKLDHVECRRKRKIFYQPCDSDHCDQCKDVCDNIKILPPAYHCLHYGKKKCLKLCKRKHTLISAKNPKTQLDIPAAEICESENIKVKTVDLTDWTLTVGNASLFDPESGTYFVCEGGDYQIELVLNFETSVPLPISPLLENVPTLSVYDVDTGETILGSIFPSVTVDFVTSPPATDEPEICICQTTLARTGQVIIKAIVHLEAGQNIRFKVCSSGLTFCPPASCSDGTDFPPAKIDFYPKCVDTTLGIYKLCDELCAHDHHN